jgi:hypothetical protein
MLALASAQQGQNPTLVLFLIVVVAVAIFWRAILAIGIAAIIVGFVFLLVTISLDILHGLHALIP